jgi:hypothetical protein
MPVTADDVRQAIADTLHKDVAEVVGPWAGIATRALAKATQDMQMILGNAGFTLAQLELWRASDKDPWLTMQALYWSLVMGGVTSEEKDLSPLDQREGLPWVTLYDENGDYIIPEGYAAMVGHGRNKAPSEFVTEPGRPEDPNPRTFKPW